MALPTKYSSEDERNEVDNTSLDSFDIFTIPLKLPWKERMAKVEVTNHEAQTEWSDIHYDQVVSIFDEVHELVDSMISEYVLEASSKSGTYQEALSIDLKKIQ
ncbi:hypothetical protein IFR05_001827 [Cadophora sp. M221]|nr:hypothetical protein IFR05_001827 [Cadophora sp. M221]